MKSPWAYVGELVELHKVTDPVERRAAWRQSMATLGRASADDGPSPLEGLNPDALAKGVHVALAEGLVDELDWLAPPAAGVALYALAAALPLGAEQRELGRRVVARLHGGTAETFVAMATRMALGSGKGLASRAVRARIELATDLPLQPGVRDGALALGLASGRELAREWFVTPSTGSLQARRFAARLLERAAREAATRALAGDDHALRVFRSDAMKEAWRRLLEDRESLVWRHVAVARGLLAPFVPDLESTINAGLRVDRSTTEWRRAATSVAGMLAVRPDHALRLARTLIDGPICERDPAVAGAFVWGLARAAEAEPEATKEALAFVVRKAPVDVAESLVELRYELTGCDALVPETLAAAAEVCRRALESSRSDDDAELALRSELASDLSRTPEGTVRHRIASALTLYAQLGARPAYAAAREILGEIATSLGRLEGLASTDGSPVSAPRASLGILRDLDISILERATLEELLRIGPTATGKAAAPDDTQKVLEELDQVRERLGLWILAREDAPGESHPTLRFRRLRTLVHLVDSDVGAHEEVGPRHRKRWTRIASALLKSAAAGPPLAFRRTVLAALARALDALVRSDLLDATDVLLLAANTFDSKTDFETLEEASMDVDLVHALSRYGEFVAKSGAAAFTAVDSIMPSLRGPTPEAARLRAGLDALAALSKDLFPVPTSRGEALRTALVRIETALSALGRAGSLKAVASGEADVVSTLELSLAAVKQLVIGARGRLDPDRNSTPPPSVIERSALTVAAARVVAAADAGQSNAGLSTDEVETWVRSLDGLIPRPMLTLVAHGVKHLTEVPVDRGSVELKAVRVQEGALPAWIPPRRTLGGFYILRSLGAGGAGSVFVANRVEDRHDDSAERFALKVPDYSPSAARMLSEQEFLALFRSEASALLSLPVHPNLARFVTFDTAARPKPILVMELVEGMTLEKVIEARGLDMGRALGVLDDVLKGLIAMHAAQVGHLDLKPSNVVLRGGETGVLVDFGLAGRHVRPGCATGPYGAPEIWAAPAGDTRSSPMAADVYAFGCLAFEALTGQMLFEAPNETAQIAAHISHDGFPPRLKAFAAKPGMTAIAELLFWTLRREPLNRPPVDRVREDLRKVAVPLLGQKWPLQA